LSNLSPFLRIPGGHPSEPAVKLGRHILHVFTSGSQGGLVVGIWKICRFVIQLLPWRFHYEHRHSGSSASPAKSSGPRHIDRDKKAETQLYIGGESRNEPFDSVRM